MGFDYLNDLFGRFRKRKSKYTNVENEAIALLKLTIEGSLSYNEIDERFIELHKKYNELIDNGDEYVVDEDTPLWLNQFLAFRFRRWHQWHLLRRMHQEHPEKFSDPESEKQYQEILSMRYDRAFLEKCNLCLEELKEARKV